MEDSGDPGIHVVTVFYPSRGGVIVTDSWFMAHGRRYAISDLASASWRTGSMQASRVVALKVIGVEVALVAGVLAAVRTPWAGVVGAADLLLVATAAWASAHRWPNPIQLWALHRGVPTMLYTSTDSTEFHKVCRALQRAIERRRDLLL